MSKISDVEFQRYSIVYGRFLVKLHTRLSYILRNAKLREETNKTIWFKQCKNVLSFNL